MFRTFSLLLPSLFLLIKKCVTLTLNKKCRMKIITSILKSFVFCMNDVSICQVWFTTAECFWWKHTYIHVYLHVCICQHAGAHTCTQERLPLLYLYIFPSGVKKIIAKQSKMLKKCQIFTWYTFWATQVFVNCCICTVCLSAPDFITNSPYHKKTCDKSLSVNL